MNLLIVIPYSINESGIIIFAKRLIQEFHKQRIFPQIIKPNDDFDIGSTRTTCSDYPENSLQWIRSHFQQFDTVFWMGLFQNDDHLLQQLELCKAIHPTAKQFLLWEKTGIEINVKNSPSPYLDFLNYIEGIFVLNESHQSQLKPYCHTSQIHIVTPGIDTKKEFTPSTSAQKRMIRKQMGWPEDALIFSYMGRFTKRKRIDLILDAWFSYLENDTTNYLAFGGSGFSQEDSVEPLIIEAMHKHSRILKEPYTENRAPFYQSSDVLLLAGEIEGEPSVLSEAMACELAIIASDIPGHKGLILHGETGLLFPPGDKEKLKLYMQIINKDAALRKYLGIKARQKAIETRDILCISKNIIKLLQEKS